MGFLCTLKSGWDASNARAQQLPPSKQRGFSFDDLPVADFIDHWARKRLFSGQSPHSKVPFEDPWVSHLGIVMTEDSHQLDG